MTNWKKKVKKAKVRKRANSTQQDFSTKMNSINKLTLNYKVLKKKSLKVRIYINLVYNNQHKNQKTEV